MQKMTISDNHRLNFKKLKDAERGNDEALMIAYDKDKDQQVLLIGSLFPGHSGKLEFEPHAEIIDLTEQEMADRYVFHTDLEEFEKAIKSLSNG